VAMIGAPGIGVALEYVEEAPPGPGGALDFSDPANSGWIAVIFGGYSE
jgi:hypothetical protein